MVGNKYSMLNFAVLFKGRWAVNPCEVFLHTITLVFYFRYDVNEALSFLADSGTNFSSADLYITPPASTLSDGDSDDEDQPESINHLSRKQLEAPAKIVFHHSTDEVSGHQQAEDDTTPTSHNSRAAKAHPPIKEKNRTAKKSRPQRKWLPVDISPKYPTVTKHQSTTLKIGRRLKCLNSFSKVNYLN